MDQPECFSNHKLKPVLTYKSEDAYGLYVYRRIEVPIHKGVRKDLDIYSATFLDRELLQLSHINKLNADEKYILEECKLEGSDAIRLDADMSDLKSKEIEKDVRELIEIYLKSSLK